MGNNCLIDLRVLHTPPTANIIYYRINNTIHLRNPKCQSPDLNGVSYIYTGNCKDSLQQARGGRSRSPLGTRRKGVLSQAPLLTEAL